jgi:hypothetical protein
VELTASEKRRLIWFVPTLKLDRKYMSAVSSRSANESTTTASTAQRGGTLDGSEPRPDPLLLRPGHRSLGEDVGEEGAGHPGNPRFVLIHGGVRDRKDHGERMRDRPSGSKPMTILSVQASHLYPLQRDDGN